jgi:ribonuclease Y
MIAEGTLIAGVTYFITRKIDQAKHDIYVEQAKQKAKAIEHEAQLLLEKRKSSLKEQEIELDRHAKMEIGRIKNEYGSKLDHLSKKEERLQEQRQEVAKSFREIKNEYRQIDVLKEHYEGKFGEMMRLIEKASGLTMQEAKQIAVEKAAEQARSEIANVVRKAESEARLEAKRKANYILAQATTRFAGEFASERLINTIALNNDELKGRIIGKEGRNIKTLEMLLGVDIIIDDTPNTIIVSSFNLYRRAIATKTIELLIEDGRIQPTRIEEIFAKVTAEFEEDLMEEGRRIVMDLGLADMHPELIKLIGRLKFRASYGQNALAHSLEVAHLAGIMAVEMDGDERLAKRAGILHDIGKAMTQDFEGSHVDLGAEVCKRYKEHPVVINAIYAHHGNEEPTSIESAAVCTADVLSAARPGARREVLENFLKRVQEIENIATSKVGVTSAYAISAGRAVRVIANAKIINDNEAVLLAKEIAEEIEKNVQYPGEIKVNVIREIRATQMAR